METLKRILGWINRVADWIGMIFSVLVFPLIFILLYEVFMRYVFNRPTIWGHELSALIYAVYFLMGGAYALRWGAHINVEILYVRLPGRLRAGLDLVTWSLFYMFLGVLFWRSIDFAYRSYRMREVSMTVWEPAIWPIKMFLPIAAAAMLILGLSRTLADLVYVITGKPLLPSQEHVKIIQEVEL